jgi:hypothetical protein
MLGKLVIAWILINIAAFAMLAVLYFTDGIDG